jgi:hypothetical protein
MPIEEEEE